EMDDHITSEPIDLGRFDTQGFCRTGYPLRRHRFEALADAGCHEARQDWIRYIGPVDEFGGCNPVNGNFTALALPLVKPERLRSVAYVLEYAFLHDDVVEAVQAKAAAGSDVFELGDAEKRQQSIKSGRKQLQSKMILQLMRTDNVCTRRIMDKWTTMLSTTITHKSDRFSSLEEYLEFRITDTGAPFVESLMLWGMGMTLSKEEDEQLADVIRPCYASLALANDYFSFDREWEDAQSGGPEPMNAVWMHMQWHGIDTSTAKKLVREASNGYEADFIKRCDTFRRTNSLASEKLDRYLRALSYEVSGNVVWSLNCPRYHPAFRYYPNADVVGTVAVASRRGSRDEADGMTASHRLSITSQLTNSTSPETDLGSPWSTSRFSSFSECSSTEAQPHSETLKLPDEERLDHKLVNAPFGYLASLPSKGVRGTLIDALNVWCDLPEATLSAIKKVIDKLHTASLMMDDIEDGSDLRRGCPAAHQVFGSAQVINSASFAIVDAIRDSAEVPVPGATEMVLEHLRDLHVGQSYDLHWTRHGSCPSVDEYIEMVTKKTGGLFLMLSALMATHLSPSLQSFITDLTRNLGVYFQIRDDYQNLRSPAYHSQKGFCEDLDEGKISFPLVHYMNIGSDELGKIQLQELLQQRLDGGGLDLEQKKATLSLLEKGGSLDHTLKVLRGLEAEVERCVDRLESETGKENWVLRLCLEKLRV
ncbi:isoprenoid synthase domain-containing protein, partial [Apodospora peruviana]